MENLGAEELDHRYVRARRTRTLAVDAPRRVERHQTCGLHLRGGVGNPPLHGLRVAEEAVFDGPVERSLTHRVVRPASHAEPAHAVMDATRDQALLRDQEAVTLLPQQ